MHICHVNLATGFSGGESQTLLLIKQQLKEGDQLTVVVNPASPLAEKLATLDVTLVSIKHFVLGHHKSITATCQLIHVHEGRAIYWAWLQSLFFNVPYIVTRRIDNPLKKKWLSKKAYSGAVALVGLSNAIVKQLTLSYPNARLYKIPSSPVDYPVQAKQVEAIKAKYPNRFLVLQASNLLPHKGHQTMIETAELLQKTESNIHFLILGDGPSKAFIEEKAKALNNVSLLGKQSDMGNWFSVADLFIHPSYSEGLGSVILEAINAGLVVVGSKAGGIPDIIEHNKTGLLFEPGNAKQLLVHIQSIQNDNKLREKLDCGAQQHLQQFTIQQCALLYKEIYQEVVTGAVSR